MIPTHELPTPGKSEADLEIQLLLSADDTGRIPFPKGSYHEISVCLAVLADLDKKGDVHRRFQNGYRAYYLTKSGERRRSLSGASKVDDGDTAPPSSAPHHAAGRAMLALVAVCLLLHAGPAQARLGESPVRIEAEYGVPVKLENGACTRDFKCTYKHGGITIVVYFLDEKSQLESYVNDSGDPIAAEEIQRLLEVNRRAGKWKLKEDNDATKRWDLNSGEATAVYQSKTGHALEIKTIWWQHFITEHPKEMAASATERLKDF